MLIALSIGSSCQKFTKRRQQDNNFMIFYYVNESHIFYVFLMGNRLSYNFIIEMSEQKYHTIDPLILETLNLNEKRMNYMLDILHGRDPRQHPRIERRQPIKSLSKNKTIATLAHDDSILPVIPFTNRKMKVKEQPKQVKNERNKSLAGNFSERRSRTIEKTQISTQKQKRQRSVRNPTIQPERTVEGMVNIEEQVHKNQTHKKEQLLKDYMMSKLKKSRSLQINPKDIYRLEIQHMVAELTPIQLLEQAERKMQRLKKRHKHLFIFDRSYYSKLSQPDLLSLS